LIHGKIGDGDTLLFEGLAGVEYGFVFHKRGDDVRVGLRRDGGRANDAEDGVIVRFGAAAGEKDLLGTRAEECGDLLPRRFHGSAGVLPEGVDGGSVGEFGREIGQHGVEHLGLDRCGGVVIEVDAVHG